MSDSPPDPLAFAPIPSRSTRRDGWTPERQRGFIAQLARIGLVSAAARAVGMSPKSAYRLRERAAEQGASGQGFLAAWDAAVGAGRGWATAVAIDRALDGVESPISTAASSAARAASTTTACSWPPCAPPIATLRRRFRRTCRDIHDLRRELSPRK